jgi:ADP-ribose pyrophosphatase YjhB (NUDIX family)
MKILEWARQVQAIAQSGLAYSENHYDRERYEQLQDLVSSILSLELEISEVDAKKLWLQEEGYATPKVDVRGAVFLDDKILLVRERADGKWTLPGGWADINDSPSESVIREIREESGFSTKAVKLAALYDRNRHAHPPMVYHVYKLFFICDIVSGAASVSHETTGVEFFSSSNLPELSVARVTQDQILRLFEHNKNREMPTDFD